MSTRFKGFVGPSYLLRNIRFDCQRCINMYPEVDESNYGKNAEVAQLTRTPGLTQLVASVGEASYGLYLASTGKLFQATESGIRLIIGVDGSTGGWSSSLVAPLAFTQAVTMTDNGLSLFAVSNGVGYAIDLTTFAVTAITNCSPTTATFLDGYVLMSNKDTNKFYWTDLYSSTVQALNFASAEANPDSVVAVFNNNEDLWVFGTKTTELWYNSGPTGGSTNTTFTRRPGILVETGLAAANTVVKLAQNKLCWLSLDDRGGPVVVLADGYIPSRVSTFAIEQRWDALSKADISAATAYSYTQDGHLFYCLNIPGVETTWCYDLTTSTQLQQSVWHERAWMDPNNGLLSRHRSEGHTMYLNKHIVADYETGAVYFLDQDSFTDNGDNIKRVRVTPHIANDGKRVFFSWLQLDVKTGIGESIGFTDPKVMLELSNDGGTTWGTTMEQSAGKLGSYSSRVIFHQLGQSRDRVFRVSMTDPCDWAISGAAIELSAGAW